MCFIFSRRPSLLPGSASLSLNAFAPHARVLSHLLDVHCVYARRTYSARFTSVSRACYINMRFYLNCLHAHHKPNWYIVIATINELWWFSSSTRTSGHFHAFVSVVLHSGHMAIGRSSIGEPEKVQKCDKQRNGARDSNEQSKEIAEQPILFISDLIAFR